MSTLSLLITVPTTWPKTVIELAVRSAAMFPFGPIVKWCSRTSMVPSTRPSIVMSSELIRSPRKMTDLPTQATTRRSGGRDDGVALSGLLGSVLGALSRFHMRASSGRVINAFRHRGALSSVGGASHVQQRDEYGWRFPSCGRMPAPPHASAVRDRDGVDAGERGGRRVLRRLRERAGRRRCPAVSAAARRRSNLPHQRTAGARRRTARRDRPDAVAAADRQSAASRLSPRRHPERRWC